MRRILVTLESRATIGYSFNVMKAMADEPSLALQTLVTGMHLMPELGNTVDLLGAHGIPMSATVPMTPYDGVGGWSKALGEAIAGYAGAFEELMPDIVLISGDRIESFGLCVAATYAGIPVAHIQAGDKSGHIDDMARMAMAKLAHIHLAPGPDSVQRLVRLGEEEFRIYDVGAPQLDDIVGRDFKRPSIDIDGREIDLTRPYILLVQHAVMSERHETREQILSTIRGCLASGLPIVWIYPNSDPGFRDILDVIKSEERGGAIAGFPNADRDAYLTLLANAACLVGNSSSGILEAPSLKVPVVNVGNRQRGRPQASNILNCADDAAEIEKCIQTALEDPDFRKRCAAAVNPFGAGRSGPRIVEILRDIVIDKNLLDKKTTY